MVRRFLRTYGLRVHYNRAALYDGRLTRLPLRAGRDNAGAAGRAAVLRRRPAGAGDLIEPAPVDRQRWLIDRVRAEPGLQAQFIQTHQFHPSKIRAYFTLITAYYKGFYTSNDAKIIHRYVLQEVGELIIYYLWLGPNPGTRRRWSSDRFREVFKRETQDRLVDKPVHPAAYRDIAISISRQFLRASSQFPQRADERYKREQSHIANLQAAHSSHITGIIYGRRLIEQANITVHRQAMFRASSSDWHRFLRFASAQSEPPSVLSKRKQAPEYDAGRAADNLAGRAGAARRAEAGATYHPARREPYRRGHAHRRREKHTVPVAGVRRAQQNNSYSYPANRAAERRRPPDKALIVLVTPESAITPEFHLFLNRLRMARTQLVLLTAMLPPTLEPVLFERIGYARKTRPAVPVRRSLADAWIDISQVVALAEQIGCEAYTSQAINRSRILARFVNGQRPIITATSALSIGVDILDIRLIIYVDTPRTLLDYAQESGWAGRDGQTSVAIADTPVPEIARMQQYLAAPCRRQVLDPYLDGQPRAGCMADEALYDQCRPIRIEDAITRMREQKIRVNRHGADQESGRPIR
ncbi:DEAD/DEAH box helicase [Aspergillus terreus]|uniref:DNA 3'-5' helicase n=1 Tax=Aspergillus terreus TaxID=33178 RepID=A0A5M3ZCX5_ASPTE|nr:hypothetical protein ATETN484_0016000400 [Aspergillus terreus]GFF21434.1 DEAD/DEAH box helicase [Aspergillus terreus]